MSKFNVGDIIHWEGDKNHVRIIEEVYTSTYKYNRFNFYNGNINFKNKTGFINPHKTIDLKHKLYMKKIKDTKLARKIYRGKIYKELENGDLLIDLRTKK